MNALSKENAQKTKHQRAIERAFLFPVVILAVYGILFAVMPVKASLALKSSANILLNMLIPLCIVFMSMVLLNLFLKPAQIARFLGKGAGIKGVLLPVAAGIISTGPIYVWYPLLKDLREKGAGYRPMAIFLYNRAVKPFLLPVMIAYFGWIYVVILTVVMITASLVVGCAIGRFMKEGGDL